MENIILNHDEINGRISIDFHGPHFTSGFIHDTDDRRTYYYISNALESIGGFWLTTRHIGVRVMS